MKQILIIILLKIIPLTFIIGAIILVFNSIGGWGWFIAGAILTQSSIKIEE
jgi:hypothetical protein